MGVGGVLAIGSVVVEVVLGVVLTRSQGKRRARVIDDDRMRSYSTMMISCSMELFST